MSIMKGVQVSVALKVTGFCLMLLHYDEMWSCEY